MMNRKPAIFLLALLLSAGAWDLSAAPKQGGKRRTAPPADSARPVRKSPSAATRIAFTRFVNKHGKGWKVRYSPRTALPEAITGGRTSRYPGSPEQAALAFFEDNKELLKVEPSALRLVLKKEFLGVTHLQYQQYKDGLPVEFSYARVHVHADGQVSGYQGKFEPELPPSTMPAVSEQAAAAAVLADLGRPVRFSKAELVIYPDENSGELRLAWKLRGRGGGLWVYYVDALDGSVIFGYDDLRYYCNGASFAAYPTQGTSSGTVYAVSPIPDYDASSLSRAETSWTPPVQAPLQDQYFWIPARSTYTITNSTGDYCSTYNGKVFSSLKGPYFAVTNFRGASAHFDNGGGVWRTKTTPVSSPQPYPNNYENEYQVTIADSDWNNVYPTGAFAKVMPRFSSFQVGVLDQSGSVANNDIVSVKNGSRVVGSYIGSRDNDFFGAAVENKTYSVSIRTDDTGTGGGFAVDISSYLILTSAVNQATTLDDHRRVVWSTTTYSGVKNYYVDTELGGANGLSEVNAFYHLNSVRRFFMDLNKDADLNPAADLSQQVPVMVHANGDADELTSCGGTCDGMLNAYYDLDYGHIILGDGPRDSHGQLRSFALDGTIVRHEYVHLVIDKIYPIINFGEFGAISEGLADYFASASFWREGRNTQVTLGNFIGYGEGSARDISGGGNPTGIRKLGTSAPDSIDDDEAWWGEVHEDGQILAQALHKLGNETAGSERLGDFSALHLQFPGLNKADVLAFAALFYFPDNFHNFYDAMLESCDLIPGCTSEDRNDISAAFVFHKIGTAPTGGDSYEAGSTDMCRTNNGPECAVDISSFTALHATINPLGDVDYYSLPLAEGDFTASLALPMSGQAGVYNAYAMFLFDADRKYLTEAAPSIYGTGSNACDYTQDNCYTLDPSVALSYSVPSGGGRYYLVVSGAPNEFYGNSGAHSVSTYTLTLARSPRGSATARIHTPAHDRDIIAFEVPYALFPAGISLTSSSMTGAEVWFAYAQLRDHNFNLIEHTRTDAAGTYLRVVPNTVMAQASPSRISGQVQLVDGFEQRYPGVGTVYLEVFGRNHMGQVLSLGVSNELSLTASRSAVTAFNNIIYSGGVAVIRYETLLTGNLSIKVYTQSGALVKTIFDGPVAAGKGSKEWDGTNSGNGKVASGIYFVKTKGAGLDRVVKVAVIR